MRHSSVTFCVINQTREKHIDSLLTDVFTRSWNCWHVGSDNKVTSVQNQSQSETSDDILILQSTPSSLQTHGDSHSVCHAPSTDLALSLVGATVYRWLSLIVRENVWTTTRQKNLKSHYFLDFEKRNKRRPIPGTNVYWK